MFSFLAKNAAGINTNKQAITTYHTDVLCINHQDVLGLAPCIHEEAVTRIALHLEYAVWQGHNKVSIRTIDTDVVVLAITSAQHLDISELWVAQKELWVNKAQKEKTVQNQKGGGRIWKDDRPVCNGEVIDPWTQLHRRRFQ